MLNGQISESALRDAILVSTRRYAKRQETWFRNQLRAPYAGNLDPRCNRDTGEGRGDDTRSVEHSARRTAHGARLVRIGITCYPTYGGSGAVATELGLELARRGHDVHFISYASPFRLRGYAERVTFHEVTQLEYPLFEQSSPYALALAVKQHEVAKREQLDLMHVH